ncbi:PucR family transcriptional regulator [Caproiciproducens sp. MSJ-32]|uniref:PucR family transcriptional regulator n=1 Tax=Caproiciproducens sp. MSJ-32 TaxID=2841527 RepID=UPI0025711DEC|nr:helix-turn-helix domain-containing protein [Caproiciproducens sp. MSJ-32]
MEKSIYNLKEDYLEELKKEYKDIFKGFNHELFQTLKEMLKCNLSLTKASKNLFIHRNTLMYRIEKIKKETGFDIRNFKEATFLYLIYLNRNV